jgi:hypothetical protein
VVVATHGRGFWILDDITPLRQLDAAALSADAFLFQPQDAMRWRWNKNTDTPLPPDEPAGENPPDGAIVHYWLKGAAKSVALEIADSAGTVIRRYTSADKVEPPQDNGNIPWYWMRPDRALPSGAGLQRFTWDLHYPPAPGSRSSWGIGATPGNTAVNPASPYVMPGTYTVRLIVDGKTMTRPLTVKMDPRVKTPVAGLGLQFSLSKMLYDDIALVHDALRELRGLRTQLGPLKERFASNQAYTAFAAKAEALESGTATNLTTANSGLRSILGLLQTSDVAPPSQNAAAANELHRNAGDLLIRWKGLKDELDALNKELGTTLKAAALPSTRLKPVFHDFEEEEELAAEP